MKKLLTAIAFVFASTTAQAAGPYDGLWLVNFSGYYFYYSIHENNGQVIAAQLADGLGSWGASSGTRNNNVIDLQSIRGYNQVIGHWVATVTSATTATIEQLSCAPAYSGAYCLTSGYATGSAQKIF